MINKTKYLISHLFLVPVLALAGERPNIVWITCEDISPYLGCYECPEAQTPNLDKLAERGVRYTNAYANSPVCAVARSTLLTGMYASTTGSHQMRCDTQLPASIPAYPKLLRQAGYYCTNNSKKDYNSNFEKDSTLWDESSGKAHWKNREEGQPFFAVFNLTTTHESQLNQGRIGKYVQNKQIPSKSRIDPKDIKLPPYHPDLLEIRKDWARLHDLVTYMDQQVGEKLRELEDAGLADNTIVFFYSDHGGMLSRSKRFIYSGGTQVPLIVHFPKKWQDLAPAKDGETCDRLVSFVDFPKTLLSLAEAEVPPIMQGSIFLGNHAEPAPQYVHFTRDRMGTRPDFSRAVTDGRHYLIRNFMPHRPLGRADRYGFQTQANWRAWENYFEAGKCDPVQSQFFQPKALIELFDTQTDPWQVTNLAGEPTQQPRIEAMSRELDRWMIETRDTGLIPEPLVPELIGPGSTSETLYEYAQSDQYPVEELLRISKETALGDRGKLSDYIAFTEHAHPVARYRGAYALFLVRSHDAAVQKTLKQMIAKDPMSANRVIAAQALGRCGDPETAYAALLKEMDATPDGFGTLYALNALQYAHLADRLTRADFKRLLSKKYSKTADSNGVSMAARLIRDTMNYLPKQRPVD
ncbi:sulfatase-like hydrolase/transferase [Haloferula sp.]|uniref:sulfatase-like hydrolase/transferase n=1 Tax=Haloferula sp. TaxID=2497595 RepID=UPI003C734C16